MKNKKLRVSKLLANLTADQFQQLLQVAEATENLNLAALARFEELMAQHGRDLYNSFRTLSSCHVYTARFQRFRFDEEDKRWYSDEVRNASPAFGFRTLQRLKAELLTMASASEGALAGLFYVMPAGPETGHVVLCLMSDGQGHLAVGFGLESGWRWAGLDNAHIAKLFEVFCTHDPSFNIDFFDLAGARLGGALKARHLAGEPMEGPGHDRFLAHWLQQEMRELGDLETVSVTHLTDAFWSAMKRMREATDELLATTKADLERAFNKRTRALQSRVETAELLSKGSQERARRLSAEMLALRQQSKKMSTPAAPAAAQSVGQAPDKLFG